MSETILLTFFVIILRVWILASIRENTWSTTNLQSSTFFMVRWLAASTAGPEAVPTHSGYLRVIAQISNNKLLKCMITDLAETFPGLQQRQTLCLQ